MPCPYCGIPLPIGGNGRQRTAHCGSVACRREYNRVRTARLLQAYAAEHGIRYEARYKVDRACLDCGKVRQTRYNGDRCGDCQRRKAWKDRGATASAAARTLRAADARRRRSEIVPAGPVRPVETLAYRRAEAKLATAAAGSRAKRAVWVGASCPRCGTSFVALWTGSPPRWCSRACARSDAKVARRVRESGGRVRYSRHAVFVRDHWVCQLCHKRVKRSAKVPDPKAPVIDHIVPLVAGVERGGVDAVWNVQCAHFLCNSIKRDQFTAPALF